MRITSVGIHRIVYFLSSLSFFQSLNFSHPRQSWRVPAERSVASVRVRPQLHSQGHSDRVLWVWCDRRAHPLGIRANTGRSACWGCNMSNLSFPINVVKYSLVESSIHLQILSVGHQYPPNIRYEYIIPNEASAPQRHVHQTYAQVLVCTNPYTFMLCLWNMLWSCPVLSVHFHHPSVYCNCNEYCQTAAAEAPVKYSSNFPSTSPKFHALSEIKQAKHRRSETCL